MDHTTVLIAIAAAVAGALVGIGFDFFTNPFRRLVRRKNQQIRKLLQENEGLRICSLTWLSTREAFLSQVDVLLNPDHDQRHSDNGIAVLFIDLDNFKLINDNFGHLYGDEVLRQVAVTIKAALRDTDILGRWGGEEIVAVLLGVDSAKAKLAAEYVCQEVRKLELDKTNVTVSIGVACTQGRVDLNTLLRQADEAVYEAKRKGKDQVCCREV